MPALPDTLDQIRRDAAAALRPRLDAMFAAADDTFFNLSQNAPAEEQSSYFDTMRDFRLRRQVLLDSTLAGIDAGFEGLVADNKLFRDSSGITLDSLTLLGDDELEVSVAFSGMLARCRDLVVQDIEQLCQRFGAVLGRELQLEQVPLHPAMICESFRKAVEPCAFQIKSRLILFKLFERHVLEGFRDVLADANVSLAKAGVLPDLRPPKIRQSSSASRASRSGAADDAEDESAGAAPGGAAGMAGAAGAFAELLALARQAGGGGGWPGGGAAPGGEGGGSFGGFAGAAGGGGRAHLPPGGPIAYNELPAGFMPVMYGGQAMVDGRVIQSDVPIQVVAPVELTALLTQLQRLQQIPALPAAGQVFEHAELESVDVQGNLSGLIQEESTEAPRALDGADNDLINLVSMLFDLILDDAELPAEMKALIGRLQIPLLKVALIDKTFFDRDDHPARALVNSLARAGIGWTREADDGLYGKIEAVVHSVLTDFTDDTGIFQRLDSGFSTFVAEREKRMAVMEARLRDREEGQAKNVVAQKEVRAAIARNIAGKALPPEVVAVVQDAWQRVLYLTAIREGASGDLWLQRVKVLEVLVWCGIRHEKEENLLRQRSLVPRLMVSLRKGMEAEGLDPVRSETMLAALRPALEKLGEGSVLRTVRVVTETVPESKVDGQATASVAAIQVLRSSEDEIVIATPAEPPPIAADAVDPRWLQTAESLAPGTWIEFHDDENNFTLRGKIAARIRAQDKFIFVNGRGVKIAEKTVQQLAIELQAGSARMISDAALFDRALETMISRLKTGVPG